MSFTGLAEFLWFLLIFGGLFAFTVWRQQRDRRRREERMAAMSAPVEVQPATAPSPTPAVPGAWSDTSWGRGPAVPEPAPDTAWGRGPAAPVPLEVDHVEVPVRAEPAALPPRPPPLATRAPRRTPAVRPVVTARPAALQFRSEAGLRQAMIALTVLGPCRALEPYGGEAPQPSPGSDRPRPR